MQFPSTLIALSSIALFSSSVAAVAGTASFVTWANTECNSPNEGTNRYQDVTSDVCRSLPNAQSIKVEFTSSSTCRINTYAAGDSSCTGPSTPYAVEPSRPCKTVTGKAFYKLVC
ncbi:hypothetical protein CC86DRAFT_369454 [Ophiobolus disseminans]|uniref:Uncharacterized protein n=1 Tax=Ophiobolus disseminans TaxID=1469910 RepID=A0A6A7A1T5_9PLEO|nr:hypothetical protein CC86DRAFT_369454 [Ophiobolus disseminans]